LSNIPVVEIGYPQIKKNIEQKRKINDNGIKSIIGHPNTSLNRKVNPKNPDRLDKEI
jgi:hypothetical protein